MILWQVPGMRQEYGALGVPKGPAVLHCGAFAWAFTPQVCQCFSHRRVDSRHTANQSYRQMCCQVQSQQQAAHVRFQACRCVGGVVHAWPLLCVCIILIYHPSQCQYIGSTSVFLTGVAKWCSVCLVLLVASSVGGEPWMQGCPRLSLHVPSGS